MTRDPTVDLVAESARAEVFKQQEAVMNVGSLPANRVVALTSLAVSIGAVLAAFAGVFPTPWANAALAVAGLLAHAPAVVTFLLGAQKSEALAARATQPPTDLAKAIATLNNPPPSSMTPTPTPGPTAPTAAIPIRRPPEPPPGPPPEPPPPQTG